jgi:hypothetical protein
MIEPIFSINDVTFTSDNPRIFTLPSQGSGQDIHVHFCSECGTKLALTFARWPDRIGLYIGTLDDPSAVSITSENAKHIFTSEAQSTVILPAGVPTYARHATELDGTPVDPTFHHVPTPLAN